MAYAVYYKYQDEKAWKRVSRLKQATRGKLKGTTIAEPVKFDTLEKAEDICKKRERLGYETKIKEVK